MRKATKTTKKRTAAKRPTKSAAKPRAAKRPTTSTTRAARKANPAGRKKSGRARRNPGDLDAAARMSEEFHGRPAHRVTEYEEPADSPRTLAELGTLRELHVDTVNEERIVLSFPRGVKLAANPERQQLYFVGGDQAVDLAEIGMEDEADKDHAFLGEVTGIVYYTKKGFHNFAPTDYDHRFGEEGGRLPKLSYDVINERLYLSGGSYHIQPEGITN